MDTKELGNLGERIACEYLVGKGMDILGKNYKIKFGEIDIIVKKKGVIHFVEVKTIIDNNDGFFPEQHVNYKKQRKLQQLAQIWLEKNKISQETAYQIDVIGILVNHATRNAKLHYFPNAVGGN